MNEDAGDGDKAGEMEDASYVGTAGDMFDFSLAAGLEPMLSSFSRIVFSDATMRRVAMAPGGEDGRGHESGDDFEAI